MNPEKGHSFLDTPDIFRGESSDVCFDLNHMLGRGLTSGTVVFVV